MRPIALFPALALGLAACGGAAPPPTAPTAEPAPVAAPEPAPAPDPAPAQPTPAEKPLTDVLRETLPGAWTFAGEGRSLPSRWTIQADGKAELCQSVLCADVPWRLHGEQPAFDFGDGSEVRLTVERVGETSLTGTYGDYPVGGDESKRPPAPFTLTRTSP